MNYFLITNQLNITKISSKVREGNSRERQKEGAGGKGCQGDVKGMRGGCEGDVKGMRGGCEGGCEGDVKGDVKGM